MSQTYTFISCNDNLDGPVSNNEIFSVDSKQTYAEKLQTSEIVFKKKTVEDLQE